MKDIQYIFFDLDHTLWDFERCSHETLQELFAQYHPHIGEEHRFEDFHRIYRHNNEMLWRAYERSEIRTEGIRKKRWELTFEAMNIEMGQWSLDMAQDYLQICPRKPYTFPNAHEVLEYLGKHYQVHMITNGWWDNQLIKLEHAGLKEYFGEIVTSDVAESKKPDREIFEYALRRAKAKAENSLYIGDNYESDVKGGMNAGWQVIYFNPHEKENPEGAQEIQGLKELVALF